MKDSSGNVVGEFKCIFSNMSAVHISNKDTHAFSFFAGCTEIFLSRKEMSPTLQNGGDITMCFG